MTARPIIAATLSALALAGCMQSGPREREPVAPAAVAIGAGERCIPLSQVRSTRVRDDWTIDFEGAGDKVWRNTLPNRCAGLGFEEAFSYSTSLTQLCSTDIIYPIQTIGGSVERRGACGLGEFVPVRLQD